MKNFFPQSLASKTSHKMTGKNILQKTRLNTQRSGKNPIYKYIQYINQFVSSLKAFMKKMI